MKRAFSISDKRGFTIVELLIVIVVIGILAAIVIVAFNGVQNRANDTAVRSDLKNIMNIIEMQNAEKGTYPTDLTPSPSIGVKVSKNSYAPGHLSSSAYYNVLYCRNSTSYAVIGMSKSGVSYEYSSTYGARVHPGGLRGSGESCLEGGVSATGRGNQWLFSVNNWDPDLQ